MFPMQILLKYTAAPDRRKNGSRKIKPNSKLEILHQYNRVTFQGSQGLSKAKELSFQKLEVPSSSGQQFLSMLFVLFVSLP